MRKKPAAESGLFNLRLFAAFAFCLAGIGLAFLSFASTLPSGAPSAGKVSDHLR